MADNIQTTSMQKAISCLSCSNPMTSCFTFITCRHMLCGMCIETLKKDNHTQEGLTCPICDVLLPEGSIVSNNLMTEIISLNDSSPRKEEEILATTNNSCLQCGSDKVSLKCLNCRGELCRDCEQRHLQIPSCQHHEIVKFLNMSNTAPTRWVDVHCTIHPSKYIEMNCVDCNQAICSQCKFEKHDTHKSESLESALDKIRPQVEDVVEEINVKLADKRAEIRSIDNLCKMLNENQALTKSQLLSHKEKMIQALIAPITKEYDQLCKEIDEVTESQILPLEYKKNDLEKAFKSESSISTWAAVISSNTSGGGLLTELQSGLMNRLNDINREPKKVETGKPVRLSHFHPSQINVPHLSLGQIKLDKQDISPSMAARSTVGGNITFRSPKLNLSKLATRIGRIEKTVKIDTASSRMCFFQEKLWIPSSTTNSINVFPIESDGETVETILDIGNIFKPNALHPMNMDSMVLAADTGLYIIDSNGHTLSEIHTGKFCDVFVDKTTLAAFEREERKLYIWSVHNLSKVRNAFSVKAEVPGQYSSVINTICLHRSHVYLSDFENHMVYKYNMEGTLIHSFGKGGCKEKGELNQPNICATDAQGDLLIADCGNHRLQVLSSTGSWNVIPMKVFKPRDAVIVRSNLYILHSEGNKISIYPL